MGLAFLSSLALAASCGGSSLEACGDGVIDFGRETCDDGNLNRGDGCNPICILESGWVCSGQPSVCTCAEGLRSCGEGICRELCMTGEPCDVGTDCESGVCVDNICQAPSCTPPDSVLNGTETDVDCGGTGCGPCADGQMCAQNSDCSSFICRIPEDSPEGTLGICRGAGCDDGARNGSESDVDCGGFCTSMCAEGDSDCDYLCATGQDCNEGSDCVSGVCAELSSTCALPVCNDDVQNQDESDVDCGGTTCQRCWAGERCTQDSDCASLVCDPSGVCGGFYRSLASAANVTCRIGDMGKVFCFGAEDSPDDGYVHIAIGGTSAAHICGLKADGSVTCWGAPNFGAATPPEEEGLSFKFLVAGADFTCGIEDDNDVQCWGRNTQGQTNVPTRKFVYLAAGLQHVCGIERGGGVECWGRNDADQITPPLGTYLRVTAGDAHSCGVLESGLTTCWGASDFGQTTPAGTNYSDFASAANATCGITPDDDLQCWGDIESPPNASPTEISLDREYGCALEARTDTLECWGATNRVPLTGEYDEVALGGGIICALDTDRDVACWCQPGLINPGDCPALEYPPADDNFIQIARGGNYTCGVNESGLLVCWGEDRTVVESVPAPPADQEFIAVAAGSEHACGLVDDGSVLCFGANSEGQGTPVGGPYEQLLAGDTFSCGLNAGTVTCWGSIMGTPSGSGFAAIYGGSTHACALDSDGAATCWGSNTEGEGTAPAGVNFSSLALGEQVSCGVIRDANVLRCWGRNTMDPADGDEFGSMNYPPTGQYTAVFGRSSAFCALDPNSRLRCWGQVDASPIVFD